MVQLCLLDTSEYNTAILYRFTIVVLGRQISKWYYYGIKVGNTLRAFKATPMKVFRTQFVEFIRQKANYFQSFYIETTTGPLPCGCATCRSASIWPVAVSHKRTQPSLVPAATTVPSRAQRARTTCERLRRLSLLRSYQGL